MHIIVKVEKYLILRKENLLHFSGLWFYKISEILQTAYVISRDIENNNFYLNNHNNWDQFNHLYNSKWQIKSTQSANTIIQKLMIALRKTVN